MIGGAPFSCLIVDNFSSGAEDFRAFVQEFGKFRTIHHDGEDYTGICPEMPDGVMSEIRRIPGMEDAEMAMQFCRRHTDQDRTTDWIHADGGIGNVAAIWYLNKVNTGGTAFYRFKRYGWEYVPTAAELEAQGFGIEETSKMLRDAANDESQWEQTMLIPAQWNRIAFYPTRRFHARYPREGFGTDKDSARLTYIAFLNL